MSSHGYIYGSGMVGCLYDNGPHWAATKEAAIDDLVATFADTFATDQDETRFRNRLTQWGVVGFAQPAEAGADYAEINEATADEAAQFLEESS